MNKGKRDLKVLLLGSSGAGKTSLAVMFERKYFSKTYEQTVVAETHSKEVCTYIASSIW
jgi:GTPase SAR1 family protein